jgi:hypothetical protein
VGFDEDEAEGVTVRDCISSDGGVWSFSSIVAVDAKERKGLVFWVSKGGGFVI